MNLKATTSDLIFTGRFGMEYARRRYGERRAALKRWVRAQGNEGSGEGRGMEAAAPPFGTTVTIDGITMRIDERMAPANITKLTVGRHTSHERALAALALREGDRVLELGGGIGMVAIACAKLVGSGNVLSFEPNPELRSLILDNYALNEVSPTLKTAMVGPAAGTATFYLAPRFSRSSAHMKEEGSRPVEVPVVPFSSVVEEFAPTVLIVDIQGGESEFLDYADLSTTRAIIIELHPFIIGLRTTLSIRRRLRRHGFMERARRGQSSLHERSG